jgi:hypothetical protein
MLFTWFENNRAFKRGSEIKGQIAPFLIVIMVVLLIAAIATINIGRVGIDKTNTANAADAGSLAAATAMASVFNSLASANQNLRLIYDEYTEAFEVPYDEAMDLYDEILTLIILAEAAYALAIYDLWWTSSLFCHAPTSLFGYFCSDPPYIYNGPYMIGAGLILGLSAWALSDASDKMIDFAADATSMKGIVQSYYEDCQEAYCNMLEMADEGHGTAVEVAYGYAFSNSGISAKLSTEQQSSYSSWVDAKSYTCGNYSWQDKLGQGHSVSVSASVPEISEYIVQHTVSPYETVNTLLTTAADDASELASEIYTQYLTTLAVFIGLIVGGILQIIADALADSIIGLIAWWAVCIVEYLVMLVAGFALCVVAVFLSAILLAVRGVTLHGVKEDIKDAYDGLVQDGTQSSSSCSDVSALLIVKVDDVPYPGDVSVSSSQHHPGTSTGLFKTSYPTVSSSASASYTGGDVGSYDDSYNSKLTSAR